MEGHTSKNTWSPQTGLDRGSNDSKLGEKGKEGRSGKSWGGMIKSAENSQRTSKNVSLKVTKTNKHSETNRNFKLQKQSTCTQ